MKTIIIILIKEDDIMYVAFFKNLIQSKIRL